MNVCGACNLDFASVPAFDAHRVGNHDYTFAEGARRERPRYDGRRCLAVSELEDAGWTKDRWDRWRLPLALEPHLLERVEL